jgi:two-component system vancomycin resistance sensor histidine kinase VraS
VDADLPDVALDLPVRRSLLLAVKEAVNNAVKYSEASELFLRIHHRGQVLHTVVEDNGRGFDLDRADETRNGLINMAERMREIGGRCRITTHPGAGCRVEFQAPLRNLPARNHSANSEATMPIAKIHGEQAGSAALFDNPNDRPG